MLKPKQIAPTLPSNCPTPTTVSKFGTINVVGPITAAYSEVRARVYRWGDEFDTNPPGDETNGDINGANYTIADVPRARASLFGTPVDDNNRLRVWGKIGQVWEPGDVDRFCGRLQTNTVDVTVSALHCIWLCWADNPYPKGPFNEEGDAYRPQGLVVPSNATRVVITVNADTWTHDVNDGAPFTNADGYGMCDLREPEYKEKLEYRSRNINPLNAPLNKLVGIWETDDGPPTAPRDQIEIGQSYSENFNAGERTRLFLAMHDGQEWSDNQGTVDVTVVWS